MELLLQVHEIRVRLTLSGTLLPEADRDWLERELREEFACFPELPPDPGQPPVGPPEEPPEEPLPDAATGPSPGPATLPLEIRSPSPGESAEALFHDPAWLSARVTPEVLIRWRPAPVAAEVVVHRPPVLDEVVLAAWARVVTALRFAGGADRAPRAAFHAASLAGAGGALLVLGDSGAGKTTLSRLLTHEGSPRLQYLGDEDALLGRGPDGSLELLALPRRLRLLHPPRDPGELPGRPFRGFGEAGWLARRPPTRLTRAPLVGVVLLGPLRDPTGPSGCDTQLVPLPRDELSYQLLRGFERFPPGDSPTPEIRERFREANREGFELVEEITRSVPGHRLNYPQPAGFPAAAGCLRRLLAGSSEGPRLTEPPLKQA